jgi:hypothetical protein
MTALANYQDLTKLYGLAVSLTCFNNQCGLINTSPTESISEIRMETFVKLAWQHNPLFRQTVQQV